MLKKYSIKEMQLIYNIVSSISGDFNNEDNINFLIAQAIPILKKDKEDLKNMSDDEKIKFKTNILEEINKIMEKYLKFKTKKMENDRIYLSYENKNYISSFVNIKTYFFINRNVSKMNRFELSEKVLELIFEGILDIESLDDIKDNDPIYWEILIEDTYNLILKTLNDIMNIETYHRPDCIKKNNEKLLGDLEEDEEMSIYSSFLENYNLTPKQVNDSKASDILASLSIMSNRQIIKEIEEKANGINGDEFYKKAFLYQSLQQMKGGKK